MQDIQVEFGRRVRAARVERSWTQARLAERLHTTTRAVSKIERGQTNISLDTIRAYACELDLSLDDLIRDASPDRIPYCAARYFAGMSDVQAMKYIKLCMDAGPVCGFQKWSGFSAVCGIIVVKRKITANLAVIFLKMVDPIGIEPTTLRMRTVRSPS